MKEIFAIYSQGILARRSHRELVSKHWVNDSGMWIYPIGVDNDGDLVWLAQDSTGRKPVVEQNSTGILGLEGNIYYGQQSQISTVSGFPAIQTLAVAQAMAKKLTFIPYSIAGGSDSDQEIWPALASYFGCIQLLNWSQGSAVADQWEHTFQDSDNIACDGLRLGTIYQNIEADNDYTPLPFGGGSDYPMYLPIFLWKATDNKALEVDTVGQDVNVGLEFIGWYDT